MCLGSSHGVGNVCVQRSRGGPQHHSGHDDGLLVFRRSRGRRIRAGQLGAVFGLTNVGFSLRAGQSIDYYYDYTITVRDDGLPADRSWGFCVPLRPGSNCGPAASSNELASVSLAVGVYDGRNLNPYLTISGGGITVSTDGGTFADGLTQTGRLHVHAETTPQAFGESSYSGVFSVYAFAAVDASPLSPIPEPATYALLLAGLGVLGLKARRRTHR